MDPRARRRGARGRAPETVARVRAGCRVTVAASLGMLALALTALAGEARAQSLCDAAKTATAMIQCLTAEQKREDTLLARVEQKIRHKLGPGGGKQFDEAAAAWRAYRKAECRAMAGSYAGGTIAPIESLMCMIELTRTRRLNLPGFYELAP